MRRKKIALIGGGQIGSTIALLVTQMQLGDVIILDTVENLNPIRGKALDISALRPHSGFDVDITPTSNYEDISDSDVVVITAGVARKPNMSREDLLEINMSIIKNVALNVAKHAPEAVVVITTNPVDTVSQAFHHFSGFPKERVVGLSGALDTSRFQNFISMETGLSVKDISCMVMGGHGPTMIPLVRTAAVGGIPITSLLSQEKIEAIVERTRNAGTEIVELLGNGSAYFSSAAAIVEMVESIILNKHRLIASSVLCEGEYDIDGYFIGVPCVLGSHGVERIIEIELTTVERQMLDDTFKAVRQSVDAVDFAMI